MSLKQRMKEKKEELKKRSQRSNIIRQKDEGTIRMRILNPGDDEEFVHEIIQFWLGKDVGSVVSPASIGEPCALMEKYKELKDSKDEEEKNFAKEMMPKTKYVTAVAVYADTKGKSLDEAQSGKLFQITGGVYQDLLDLYLDEDEWGDMVDPKNGYDVKFTREGLKMMDTNYSVQPCKNTKAPKGYTKPVDLLELVKAEVATYEETVSAVEKYLGGSSTDEEEAPKKKRTKKGKRKKKDI